MVFHLIIVNLWCLTIYKQKKHESIEDFQNPYSLKALKEEYKKMMEKPADYNFQSDDGTYSDHMTLTTNEHKGIYR